MDDNQKKIIEKQQVMEMMQRNFLSDVEEFDQLKSTLKHGQKDRLLSAIIRYPLVDTEFDQEEVELRQAFSLAKRISDILVAQGVEIVVESLLNQKQASQGEENVGE